EDLAVVVGLHAGETLDEGGLPRAVVADEGGDAARMDLEVHALEDADGAERLRDTAQLDDGFAHAVLLIRGEDDLGDGDGDSGNGDAAMRGIPAPSDHSTPNSAHLSARLTPSMSPEQMSSAEASPAATTSFTASGPTSFGVTAMYGV